MHELGNIQNTGHGAYVNRTTPKRAVCNKAARDQRFANDAGALAGSFLTSEELARLASRTEHDANWNLEGDERKSFFQKSSFDLFREIIAAFLSDKQTADFSNIRSAADFTKVERRFSEVDFTKIDMSFGVEELSYKNMWKVLKIVAKERGDIKEANFARLLLGVNERLSKFSTQMEFGSIMDYLNNVFDMNQEITPEQIAGTAIDQIAVDPVMSLIAQANIAPNVALYLLTNTG